MSRAPDRTRGASRPPSCLPDTAAPPGAHGRRAFLKRLAAGGAALCAPLIVPCHVLGGEHGAPPSERVAVAVIGTGGRGMFHVINLLRQRQARILALCDVHAGRREETRKGVVEGAPRRAVLDPRRLPGAPRSPRHSTPWSSPPRPLARPPDDRRRPRGQGRLLREAPHAHRRGGAGGRRAVRRDGHRLPARHPAALRGVLPHRRGAGPERPHREAPPDPPRRPRRPVHRPPARRRRSRRSSTTTCGSAPRPGRPTRRSASSRATAGTGSPTTAWATSPAGACTTSTAPSRATAPTSPGPSRSRARGLPAARASTTRRSSWRLEYRFANGVTLVDADVSQRADGRHLRGHGGHGLHLAGEPPRDPARGAARRRTSRPAEVHVYESPDHMRNFLDCVRTRQRDRGAGRGRATARRRSAPLAPSPCGSGGSSGGIPLRSASRATRRRTACSREAMRRRGGCE